MFILVKIEVIYNFRMYARRKKSQLKNKKHTPSRVAIQPPAYWCIYATPFFHPTPT